MKITISPALKDRRLITPAIIGFAAGMLTWGQAHASQQYQPEPAPTTSIEVTAPITSNTPSTQVDPNLPPVDATVYEDGSWVAGDESGCLPWGLCND